MSISGTRSNRGDAYQTLVAFEWALTVLFDPDFQWIEIDSVINPLVDDVVIGKFDGTLICCQCKKNHIDFKSWTITDLADELDKAICLLVSNPNAEVRFYSRSPFGALHKLREHRATQADEKEYKASLCKDNRKTDKYLEKLIREHTPNLSTYEILGRMMFEVTPELDRMEAKLIQDLRNKMCNPDVAYSAIWTALSRLGARLDESNFSASGRHRLSKENLKDVLSKAGAMIAPIMSLAEVRLSFASTSVIGKKWSRDIAGHRISLPVLKDLLAAIDAGNRSILLQGPRGSGKTCVMLELQESLENRAKTRTDMELLFIQSREFADLTSAQDREAHGLPEKWPEKVARMAEESRVIVIIDSLDVLSIAHDHGVLNYFLAQIDRILLIPNTTVVTACREFDRHYDRRIAERKWDCELVCQPLNWDTQIPPLLNTLGINADTRPSTPKLVL